MPNASAEQQTQDSKMADHNYFAEKPDTDTLGGRLLRARDASGMSAAQFARRLGVKTATVQAWENDRSEPRANRLSMIAGILNVSTPWLLHGVGEAPADDPRNDAINILQKQVSKLRKAHEESADLLSRIEDELMRLQRFES
jgi:transcriptional regulator with XRE-family HTH domain